MKYSGTKIEKLLALPTNPRPNQFYLIESGGVTEYYLSDSSSNLILLNGGGGGPGIPGFVYSEDIGDGVSTDIVVTHNLGSRDIFSSVRSNSTPWEVVICDIEYTTIDTATIRFTVAPTTDQYRITLGTAQGTEGPQGPQGFQGDAGIGSQGAQGNQGNIGNQGDIGNQGNQGEAGTQGSQGNQGNIGNQGNQGNQGAGTQGPQGYQGTAGTYVGSEITVSVTTASLANNAIETGTITIGRQFVVKKVVADRYTEVRLYGDSAARTADASRVFGDLSFIGTQSKLILGLLLDVGTGLTWACSPPALGENCDGPTSSTIYYSIKNLSGSTSPVTIDFHVLILEA